MSDGWYDLVEPDSPLTQGDLIADCPVLAWKEQEIVVRKGEDPAKNLSGHYEGARIDGIIMTQACDLEQRKVRSVTVCAHFSLGAFKADWEALQRERGDKVSKNAWRKYCNRIKNGFLWNLCMLNGGEAGGQELEHRVVDFHEVYTLPLGFLQSFVAECDARFRLRPPYREHLSQAFARFYMRVGLPEEIVVAW